MSTLGYRQGSGEAIPAVIHPSYVAGGQTWTVLSGVKKDVLNTVNSLRFKTPKPSPSPLRSCLTHLPLILEDGVMRLVEDRSIDTLTPLMRPFLKEVGRRIYQYTG